MYVHCMTSDNPQAPTGQSTGTHVETHRRRLTAREVAAIGWDEGYRAGTIDGQYLSVAALNPYRADDETGAAS